MVIIFEGETVEDYEKDEKVHASSTYFNMLADAFDLILLYYMYIEFEIFPVKIEVRSAQTFYIT